MVDVLFYRFSVVPCIKFSFGVEHFRTIIIELFNDALLFNNEKKKHGKEMKIIKSDGSHYLCQVRRENKLSV